MYLSESVICSCRTILKEELIIADNYSLAKMDCFTDAQDANVEELNEFSHLMDIGVSF